MPTPSTFSGAVIERAKATPEIAAMVGTRVFKGLGPPATPMPYIEVHEIANVRDMTTTSWVVILQVRVQATICAASDPTTIQLTTLLENAVTSPAPPLQVHGMTVLYTDFSDDFLAPADELAANATPQFRRIVQISGVCQRNP